MFLFLSVSSIIYVSRSVFSRRLSRRIEIAEKKTKEERIKEENEGGIACQRFFK
jgi:hypothetical protein